MLNMLLAKDKDRAWMKHGGIFNQLIAGCTPVYLLSRAMAALILTLANRGLLPFSGSARFGLMMGLFAIGMLALGSTPVG